MSDPLLGATVIYRFRPVRPAEILEFPNMRSTEYGQKDFNMGPHFFGHSHESVRGTMYVYVCVIMYVCVCMYVCMYICLSTGICVYIYICVCVYMYVQVHM